MDTPDAKKPALMLVSPDDMEGLREFVLALTGEELTAEDEAEIRQALSDAEAEQQGQTDRSTTICRVVRV